jgi:hypothetical protein
MPDQPAQVPTREENLAATAKSLAFFHLASCQMREATRASYHAITESKELLAQTDKMRGGVPVGNFPPYRERDWRPSGEPRLRLNASWW